LITRNAAVAASLATVFAACSPASASTAERGSLGLEASTSVLSGPMTVRMDSVALLQKYYARQYLQGLSSPSNPDPSSEPAAPSEEQDPESLLRCDVPVEGVMPSGSFNYGERGSSWLLSNGPAICASRADDTTGTYCFAQRNATISPWTFYVVYGSRPQIGGTSTFGRAVSSCTFGPGKRIFQKSPEPEKVKCGTFVPNRRLGNYSDIKEGGYAATLEQAQQNCNNAATPVKGYCIAYRNQGTTGSYQVYIGGDHPTDVNWNGTEGWVSRCE
jgi:hypothetical protein